MKDGSQPKKIRRPKSGRASIVAMLIEPIGSIPTPVSLIESGQGFRSGRTSQAELLSQHGFAVQDAVARFGGDRLQVVTDGEQPEASFAIYSIHSLMTIAADGRHALCLLTTLAADPATIRSCRGR